MFICCCFYNVLGVKKFSRSLFLYTSMRTYKNHEYNKQFNAFLL